MSKLKLISQNKAFGGWHQRYEHYSKVLHCTMTFAVYCPPNASVDSKVPVIYWLSGLTCTDENFMQKAGAMRVAAELGVMIVCPDTSPRGAEVPDDVNGDYDLGLGASFYVNAKNSPWNKHYHMYDYVLDELPALIEARLPATARRAISGHSMGGHGALVLALRNPKFYVSVSAFSPISNPISSPWGQKAFSAYLGDNQVHWQQFDASQLVSHAKNKIPALVDQGTSDDFLLNELKPEKLKQAAIANQYPLTLNMHEGYDHSYYFIASFIEDHFRFHNKYLCE